MEHASLLWSYNHLTATTTFALRETWTCALLTVFPVMNILFLKNIIPTLYLCSLFHLSPQSFCSLIPCSSGYASVLPHPFLCLSSKGNQMTGNKETYACFFPGFNYLVAFVSSPLASWSVEASEGVSSFLSFCGTAAPRREPEARLAPLTCFWLPLEIHRINVAINNMGNYRLS